MTLSERDRLLIAEVRRLEREIETASAHLTALKHKQRAIVRHMTREALAELRRAKPRANKNPFITT